MQVPLTDAVLTTPVATGGGVIARVISGNITAVPLGAMIQATVTSVKPREATLTVNGQELTVQATPGLRQGAVLLVRVQPGVITPTLELTLPARTKAEPEATPILGSARPTVIDVLATLPEGRARVSIEGRDVVVSAPQPLVPGERYVVQIAQSPAGVSVRPLPSGSATLADIAAGILRIPSIPAGEAIAPLRVEVANLGAPQVAPSQVREAATAVRATLNTLIANEPRALNAVEIQQFVERGGLQSEAKLARADDAGARIDHGPDLKSDLLRLLQLVRDLGPEQGAPAARAALHGIEAQQAFNVLAQAGGTPYLLQIPIPDGGVWRTLNIALDPQNRPDQPDSERAGRFRLLMHVPLTELGETWIEAGLSSDRFRATLYLEQSGARERVREALTELRTELQNEGFAEVLLDVRASSELPERRRRETAAMLAGRPESLSVLDVRV